MSQVTAAVSDPLIVTDAPREIGIVPVQAGDDIYIHLINYDYNPKSGFAPKENVSISLRLPSGLSPAPRYLEWREPGGAGGTVDFNFNIEERRLGFAIPVIHEYCLVVFWAGVTFD
jgi:hypothetical protein